MSPHSWKEGLTSFRMQRGQFGSEPINPYPQKERLCPLMENCNMRQFLFANNNWETAIFWKYARGSCRYCVKCNHRSFCFYKVHHYYIQLQSLTLVFLIQDDSLLVKITACLFFELDSMLQSVQ